MFDLTSYESFDHLESWKQNFLEKCMPKDPANFPFFIFGNKKDLQNDRQVATHVIKEFCKRNNDIPYEETSALDS